METKTLETASMPGPLVEYGRLVVGLFIAVIVAAVLNHPVLSPIIANVALMVVIYLASPGLLKALVVLAALTDIVLVLGGTGPVESTMAVLVFSYNLLLALLVSAFVAAIVIFVALLLIGAIVIVSWLATNVNESRAAT